LKNNGLENEKFDIISIDIEGMDYEVLSQMNLDELGCKILCIEFNGLECGTKIFIIQYCKFYYRRLLEFFGSFFLKCNFSTFKWGDAKFSK
jgi:hypothetical protein